MMVVARRGSNMAAEKAAAAGASARPAANTSGQKPLYLRQKYDGSWSEEDILISLNGNLGNFKEIIPENVTEGIEFIFIFLRNFSRVVDGSRSCNFGSEAHVGERKMGCHRQKSYKFYNQ